MDRLPAAEHVLPRVFSKRVFLTVVLRVISERLSSIYLGLAATPEFDLLAVDGIGGDHAISGRPALCQQWDGSSRLGRSPIPQHFVS